MNEMFSFEVKGAQLAIKVATSVKKDGSFRYREYQNVGGDGFGVRGFLAHHKKVDDVLATLNRVGDGGWECKHFLAMYQPKHYYAYLTNGTIGFNYIYTATDAPGSGLGVVFCPQLSRKNIRYQVYHHELAALIIGKNIPLDYSTIIDKWDRNAVWKLLQDGLDPDCLEATLQIIR